MGRSFVSEFLLPLVQGGTLFVGRPLFPDDIARLMRAHQDAREGERDAAAQLTFARRRALLALVSAPPVPTLDVEAWQLGAAVHNLLALTHPRIGTGPGSESRVERVAAAAAALARLGPPPSQSQALTRHSLVARLPDVVRQDHTVRFWLGRRTFVGRPPPTRMLALPRLRGVRVESVRRTWMRDVGVLAAARPAFTALTQASPLGEAFDPLRLDPPWSWGRVLSILRFPALCRAVAGRLVDLGVAPAGDALVEALYRFVSLQDASDSVPSSPYAVAFAAGFLAHLTWLGHLFAPGMGRPAPAATGATMPGDVGRELVVLLAALAQVDPDLIWPPDVARGADVSLAFTRRLERLFGRHDVTKSPRWPLALEVARMAASSARASTGVHGV